MRGRELAGHCGPGGEERQRPTSFVWQGLWHHHPLELSPDDAVLEDSCLPGCREHSGDQACSGERGLTPDRACGPQRGPGTNSIREEGKGLSWPHGHWTKGPANASCSPWPCSQWAEAYVAGRTLQSRLFCSHGCLRPAGCAGTCSCSGEQRQGFRHSGFTGQKPGPVL